MAVYNPVTTLDSRKYISLNALTQSLSSSLSSSSTSSLASSRLKISNLLNTDVIFPINIRNLSETIHFGSAYLKTKVALNDILNNYPIGLSGSSSSTLYLEDIERANNYISTLTDYQFWVLRQLCGASLTSDALSFTASATAIRQSLSSTITSNSPLITLPVIIRDTNNFLLPPQGVYTQVKLDNYYNNLLDQDPVDVSQSITTLTPYEQILATAIMFDRGLQYSLKNWSGTGDHDFVFNTYDGVLRTQIIPEVLKERQNRSDMLTDLIPAVMKQDDDQDILDRLLGSMGDMFDELKVYVDGLQRLFKNHWANFDKIPKGYIQQLIAEQYGIELFSSENRFITDELQLRGTYKSQKEITFEFWNRILCSLTYILKTKGSVESIKATARAYGITPSMLQIYELASYKSQINAYYNETRNYSIAKFRSSTNGDRFFTSISAATSGSISSVMVHCTTTFEDTTTLKAAQLALSGIIWKLSPNYQLAYDYRFDNDNISTSGFPYINFTFTCSGANLSTGYNFVSQAYRLSENKTWELFFGRSGSLLYATLGFIPSNTNFFEPVITTLSSTVNSLSSSLLSYTSFSLGSTISPPNVNISNVHVQNITYSPLQIKNIILDPTYVSAVSGYKNNILVWKLNEHADMVSPNQNYILDAGPSSITGAVSLIGSNNFPYDYAYEVPAFFNDDIPGFKLQLSEWNNSISAIQDVVKEKGMRVGISLAEPLDTYAHTIFGSGFGQLFADPNFIFSLSGTTLQQQDVYPLANEKINNLFSAIGASRNQIQISEYLKFLNRINGHLGSFFEFIEQVIPASKRLVEKGIIVENPFYLRTILKKSQIKIEGPFNPSFVVSANLSASVTDITLPDLNLNIISDIKLNKNTLFSTEINISPSATLEYVAINNSSDNDFIVEVDIDSTLRVCKSFDASISASISGDIDTKLTKSGDIFLALRNDSTLVQPELLEYIPRHVLQPYSYTYFANTAELDLVNNYLNRVQPQNIGLSSYFMNIVLDRENPLLRTSLSASLEEKRVKGIIFITDQTGRKISTDYYAVQVNTSECLLNGLNRVRVIMDGEDLPFNQKIKKYKISNSSGINFEINVKNAPNDGISSNVKTIILFDNLLNDSEIGKAIELRLGDSIENFVTDVGAGFSST